MRNKLARGTLALLTAAASVAGITTAASAAHVTATDLPAGSVGGYNITWTAQGTPVGDLTPSSYTLVKGNGELDFVFFGEDFTPGSHQDITLHRADDCAILTDPYSDPFAIDTGAQDPAGDTSPRAIATVDAGTKGTAGTLRFTQGANITAMDTVNDDILNFEHEYKIIIRERGAAATNYLCGTPSFDENVGSGANVGTVYPYNFKELNGSGTTATGSATLQGNILFVSFEYAGLSLVPAQHFQVLSSGITCPAGNTAVEGDITAGTIEASLTWVPRSILPAESLTDAGFDVSVSPAPDGTLTYTQKIPLTPTQSNNFGDFVVSVHGFDVNGNETSDGPVVIGSMQGDETAVAGCGQFQTTAPATPVAPTAAVDADSVTVTWAAPSSDGASPITGYTVALSNGDELTVAAGTTVATFTGLIDGNYTATVLATNAIGSSAASAASNSVTVDSSGLTPPTAVKARPVGQKLIVSWTAPVPAPDGYTVTLAPGGASKTVTATNATFEGLSVDTYVASVVANYGTQSSVPALSAGAIIRDCQDGDVDADWDGRVVTAANGSLFRLYCGYFLRYPDDGGWDYWSGIQAGGADLIAISDEFALSQEFLNTYGSLNNDQFVRLLYQNVLLRDVDQEGYDYWKNFLDTGQLSQGGTMRWVAEGVEFQAVTGTP